MRPELVASIGDLVRRQGAAHGKRLARCRTQLAAYELPRPVAFVAEWPETASGKVQRFLLRPGG
jgi:acyl-coenzyme A synthetase/AMP-(fatty) acid ligase